MACNLGENILLNTSLDHSPESRMLRGLFNQHSKRISAHTVYGYTYIEWMASFRHLTLFLYHYTYHSVLWLISTTELK